MSTHPDNSLHADKSRQHRLGVRWKVEIGSARGVELSEASPTASARTPLPPSPAYYSHAKAVAALGDDASPTPWSELRAVNPGRPQAHTTTAEESEAAVEASASPSTTRPAASTFSESVRAETLSAVASQNQPSKK